MQHLQPIYLRRRALQDLTDLAKEFEPKYGKYYDQVNQSGQVDGQYRGVPYNIVGNAFVYRKSMFDKAGVKAPDDLGRVPRRRGKALKAMGKPPGRRSDRPLAMRRVLLSAAVGLSAVKK